MVLIPNASTFTGRNPKIGRPSIRSGDPDPITSDLPARTTKVSGVQLIFMVQYKKDFYINFISENNEKLINKYIKTKYFHEYLTINVSVIRLSLKSLIRLISFIIA